jgi:hypothetical protein
MFGGAPGLGLALAAPEDGDELGPDDPPPQARSPIAAVARATKVFASTTAAAKSGAGMGGANVKPD